MKRPYTVCHMMATLDGRIDCAMTSKFENTKEYYETLNALNVPTTVSGKTTAKMELTGEPDFEGDCGSPAGKEMFFKAESAEGYSVVTDTKGSLGWKDKLVDGKPLIVIMSQQAGDRYLDYLKRRCISYIVCGEKRIDLGRASEILASEFGVKRMGIVGGGTINAGFLDAGLLDEISLLFAPGIDGRGGMKAAFDGLPMDREPFKLTLEDVESYKDGSLWLRYTV